MIFLHKPRKLVPMNQNIFTVKQQSMLILIKQILMVCVQRRKSKFIVFIIWFDPIVKRTVLIQTSILRCLFRRLVCSVFPLDCPFVIAPSVFPIVYMLLIFVRYQLVIHQNLMQIKRDKIALILFRLSYAKAISVSSH